LTSVASPFLMRVGNVFNEVIHNFIHAKCVKKILNGLNVGG